MAKKALEPATGSEPEATLPATAEAALASAEPAQAKPEQAKPETAEAETKPTAMEGRFLSIRSAHGRTRRRAGQAFGKEAVEIAIEDLTVEDVIRLVSDPQLVVEGLTDDELAAVRQAIEEA